MTPSRGSKSSPKETLALPSPFAPISPYCPPACQRNELLFHSPDDITTSPTFPWQWQAGEAEAKDEGQAQGEAGLCDGGGSCSLPIRPGDMGTGRPLPSPAKWRPPRCSLFRVGLQEHPPLPHSGIRLPQRPALPPYPFYPQPCLSLPIPLGALGRGTSVSLSSAALFPF